MNAALEDEFLIRRVLEHYMRYNDDRAIDRLLSLFAEDAIYRVAGREYVGHEEMRSFLGGAGFHEGQPRWTDEGQLMVMPRSMHLMTNPVIDVAGDHATAESEFVVIVRDDSGRPKMSLVGRYRDRLRRDPVAGWLFTERTGVSLARQNDPPGREEPLRPRPEA